MTESPDKLVEYGETFLTKSIETLLLNYDFFVQFRNHFKIEYFDDSLPHKFILEKLYEYYDKYNILPTVNEIESINNVNKNEYLKDKIDTIIQQIKINILTGYEKAHYDYYIDQLKQFRQRQIYTESIKQSIIHLKQKEFKKIDGLFHKTIEDIDLDFSIYEYLEEFDSRMHPDSRHGIKTLWPEVDNILEGTGLMTGEIGFIMGETGKGKCIGANTKIDIKYDQFLIEINGEEKWYNPWDIVNIGNKQYYIYELIGEINNGKNI